MRFTLAFWTPGAAFKARWTFAWHAAHVMPSTGSVTESVGGASRGADGIPIRYPLPLLSVKCRFAKRCLRRSVMGQGAQRVEALPGVLRWRKSDASGGVR
jgi:hypothetical protein